MANPAPLSSLPRRIALVAIVAVTALALHLAPTAAAEASARSSAAAEASASHGSKRQGKKSRAARRKATQRRRRAKTRRMRRANRSLRIEGNKALGRRPVRADSSSSDVLDAGFENGLDNWNTAGVGEVIPTVSGDVVRSGAGAGRFVVSGDQHRSELILGGNGGGSADDAVRFHDGNEFWYSFSFYIQSMVYGEPGAHNLIMQFKGDDEGSPYFGLQLWDYEGDDGDSGGRGLWSHGEGMDGDRFLSPVAEQRWHDVVVHIKASQHGDGFYEIYLNGALLDSASGISTYPSDADHAYIKSGLYRNGDEIPGTSEIRLDAVKLGRSADAVAPS